MKLSLPQRAGAITLAAALTLTLAACGSDDPVGDSPAGSGSAPASTLSGTLNGGGSSAQEKAQDPGGRMTSST